jgi:hypothetical protein
LFSPDLVEKSFFSRLGWLPALEQSCSDRPVLLQPQNLRANDPGPFTPERCSSKIVTASWAANSEDVTPVVSGRSRYWQRIRSESVP